MPVGYVALLDVLGFSTLVRGDGAAAGLEAYREGLQKALAAEADGVAIEYVVFSDTIVITTANDAEASLQALARRCSRLLGLMLYKEIALRGAIARGSYERSVVGGSVFIAGTAILEAYRFETAQDWVGVMLAPSALRRVPDMEAHCSFGTGAEQSSREGLARLREHFLWSAFVQRCQSIPFHQKTPFEDSEFDGFAVVPTSGVAEPVAVRDSLTRALGKLEWLKSLAPEPAAQAKYRKAQRWLYQVADSWNQIAYWVERFAEEDRVAAEQRGA